MLVVIVLNLPVALVCDWIGHIHTAQAFHPIRCRSLWWAHMFVFQMITADLWYENLISGYHSVGAISTPYMLLVTLMGNFIVYNIFVASERPRCLINQCQ